MNRKSLQLTLALCASLIFMANAGAAQRPNTQRPNIIVVFADDISARELPLYGSSVWSPPTGGDTSDQAYRASTPVLDKIAQEGCWIKTAWASVVCSPSRAMMMTGRYAHIHKWWGNKSKGTYVGESGRESTWPLYLSSPTQIGHIAQQSGYATYWAGKTQMAGDLRRFGFDQGCFTPGSLSDKDNPYTDFKHFYKKIDGTRQLFNADTNQPVDTYQQHGWYWFPHVRLMNHDDKDFQWWPNTPESHSNFGPATYGPDVELDFIFDFMEKQVAEDKPFFVYHTSHLGHDAFNWLDPASKSKWPGTPVIRWDGEKYTRTQPQITGDNGKYDTHGTVTPSGIHHHINYLDYQAWLYRNKLEALGIADNTIFIFCADNGTSGYGKNSTDRQKGTHVPLIISAPGLTKRGEQDALVNLSDFLPTIAELIGAELPDNYEINGESLVPFLFGEKPAHRGWLYGYKDKDQIIRGMKVMRDGRGKWWDVEKTANDLISFPQITDWGNVSAAHRAERDKLLAILPRFDQEIHGKNAPDTDTLRSTVTSPKKATLERPTKTSEQNWIVTFADDYEDRGEIGDQYTVSLGHEDAWNISGGVLVGKQTRDDHGGVIRTQLDFADVDIQFDFRFDGGKSFNFVIDDAHEKSVHAGHICRASVYPKYLVISDDKTGGMNLEVRKQRKDKNLSEEATAALQTLLDQTKSSAKVTIKQNEWHRLRIRIRGDVMKAFLDDEIVTSLKSPGFAHPTKTKFGFTVNGQSIDFDNLVVRQIGIANALHPSPSTIRETDSRSEGRPSSDLKISFGRVSRKSVFSSETWSHWGGSVVKGEDDRYHMLYSRWPKKLGWAWVTDSEIAHATAPTAFGPFEHQGVALPRRSNEHWDGWCTHNPTVHKFDGKYYLYHMGNTGDGEIVGYPGKQLLNWQHRNNQRIGVAVADDPSGPWTRLDSPVLDVSDDDTAADALMTSNPSVCQRPDGKILMVYKAVGKEFPMPNGGPVVHMVAIGDSPTGPFKKMRNPVFTFEGERFPAEDPYIWYQDGKYRAIVKRITHEGKKRVFSLVHYDSIDGIDWQPAKHHEISDRSITWEDGATEQLDHLERPQVVVEEGKPIALICAADRIDENNVRHSINVQIPLVVTQD